MPPALVHLCPFPCPSVSLSLSVCVPVPDHLCPCPCPPVSLSLSRNCPSLSMSVCVPVPIHLCPCSCPFRLCTCPFRLSPLSLSVCVHCLSVALYVCVSVLCVPVCVFVRALICRAYFNRLTNAQRLFVARKWTDNVWGYFCCRRTTFSAYNFRMAADRKLSALSSSHSIDQINESYLLKATCPTLVRYLPLRFTFTSVVLLSSSVPLLERTHQISCP